MDDATPILPAHIESTIEAIARLHAEHHAQASGLQRLSEILTAHAGRPSFMVGVTALLAAWVALNCALIAGGVQPLDAPPFPWMQGAVSLGALYMTIIILTTERNDDRIATHREQLTLELGILSEQKAAKIIALLEELRRDMPVVRDRADAEAAAMSAAADPEMVLGAIKDRHEEFKVGEAV